MFSNQGVGSTTGAPQIHQIRYSSTPSTQIQIHNDHQPTVSPIFHATSSTIQTLLNSNANSPALINPIFHNHGIASTTEHFTVHNNNPRETDEYRDDDHEDRDNNEDRRPLEAVQPTTQGKVSKLTISPIPAQEEADHSSHQAKNIQQQQRVTTSFLPTPSSDDGQAVRSFYPTPRTSTKSSSSHVTHIHLPPPPTIPHLKPHQITINLPTPDIQRIVQNPSPLLPSQSRVIVTAKASVSDESGRSLNTTQLVTLPLPTIPASYDDYKEGDESFDPFYRDVPKVRNDRRVGGRFRWPLRESREKRSRRSRRDVGSDDTIRDSKTIGDIEAAEENRMEAEKVEVEKIDNLRVEKIETRERVLDGVDDKKDKKPEDSDQRVSDDKEEDESKLKNDEAKGGDHGEGDRTRSNNDERKDDDDGEVEKSKTKTDEVKDEDGSEDKRLEIESEEVNDMIDLKTMSSRHLSGSGEIVHGESKTEIDQVNDEDGSEDKRSEVESKEVNDMVDLKTMSTRHHSDSGEKVDEKLKTESDEVKDGADSDGKRLDMKNADLNDMVDLKTMSTRHHSDSEEKVDDTSSIDSKESDREKSVSGINTRESDVVEYVDTSDETFDSKIFDEPESQTSKEVDTRAVAEQDSKYSQDQTNRFGKDDKSLNHEYVNGLGTTKRGPEEESSRFSLLPEVVSPTKSHRRHSTKKLTLRERIHAEEEDEEKINENDEEEDEEEEEIVDQRKSHRKHSAKKSKAKQRLPLEDEADDEIEEEEEVINRRKSHRKHSAEQSKTKQRLPIEVEEEDEESEEEDDVAYRRKSHGKHSAKKLKTKQRLPVEEEEEGEESAEDVDFDHRRKSHHKHSAKRLKTKQRLPIQEEEDDDAEEEEDAFDVNKSSRKHSARKSNTKQRLPEEEEEYEENDDDDDNDQREDVVKRRKSHRKHSTKKSKKKDRLPAVEEEEEEAQSRETSFEKIDEDAMKLSRKLHEERRVSRVKFDDDRETSREDNLPDSYDYYDSEMDSTSARSDEEDSAEYSKESPNKIDPSSRHRDSRRRDKSFTLSDEASREKSSRRRDKSTKFAEEDNDEEEDYDFSDGPVTRSNEEVSSIEISNDYADSSRSKTSHEDSSDVQEDEEEMLLDDTTSETSSEQNDEIVSSTEKLSSPEKATTAPEKNSRPDDKRVSEGVLKFTDEIPNSEGTHEPEQVESSKSAEENSQDYIDDNYEPQSYKEHEQLSTTTDVTITEKIVEKETSTPRNEDDEHDEEMSTTETIPIALTEKAEMEDKQNDQAQLQRGLPEVNAETVKPTEKPIERDETTNAASAMTSTTSSTTTTSTTTTSTTTARPTPPKLFKPFTLRKSYVYTPPTTTPVPVVIKPRLPLLNPKPAKPPKSYNDLAPKPIIRKTPLFARKTTVRTTTLRTEVEDRESSTELPVAGTDTSTLEVTTPSASTTPVPTTEAPQASSQATVTAASRMEDDDSSAKESHVPLSTTLNFQLSSTIDTETFTPYPLLVKMTEAAVALEQLLTREESPTKQDISTTERGDVENNNVPSVSEPESSTTPEAVTTPLSDEVSSEKPVSSSTEGPLIFEIPAIETTSVSSILRQRVTTNAPQMEIPFTATIETVESEVATKNPEITTTSKEAITNNSPTLASVRAVNRRPGIIKRTDFFNCLEKEMYRFYADGRDCRLFHYCSPGFTSRQVLDFRFVCEEGTAFDEESQSCIHDVRNPKCRVRVW